MTHDDVQRWLDGYVEAWRTYDTEKIGALFAPDVTYRYQPYEEPIAGREAVVAEWVESPDAAGSWQAHYEPYAVEGDRAVAVGTSRYLDERGAHRTIFHNVFLLRFDSEGQCADFIEYWREPPVGSRTGGAAPQG